MHSSLNTGRFLLTMAAPFNSSLSSGLEAVRSSDLNLAYTDIDADGGMRGLSDSSVALELNSSGLYRGSTLILELENGKMNAPVYRPTTVVSSGTTALSLTSAMSGTLAIVSTNAAGGDTVVITLPATPAVGDNFEVYSDTSAASILMVKTAATGDNQGFIHYVSTGDFRTTAAIRNASSGTAHFRFTAASSGSLWLVGTLSAVDNSTNVYGQAAAGTTTT
jgi:hypothetical protein